MTVKKINDTITLSLEKIQSQLDRLPQQAYDVWIQSTPVRTGNARRRTRLRGNEIDARYPYAVPLDQGRSRQAPDGMVKPTERFIEQQLRKIIRK